MFLMEYSDGIRPYVLEWYYQVFLEKYNHKTLDSKTIIKGVGQNEHEAIVYEKMVALTTEDLVEKTKQVYKRAYTKEQIRDTYIYPLLNQGYIDNTDSEIDKRSKIYYPLIVIENDDKNKGLHDKNKSCNLFQQSKIYVDNPLLYPSKQYIKSQIEALLRYTIQNALFKEIKIVDHNEDRRNIKRD
jgi:hypothetical protein